MARGDYLSKPRVAILYIKEILENYSTIESPLSGAQILRILSEEPYNMDLHRETLKDYLMELSTYDDELYRCETTKQDGTDGYSYGWYYNRSSSTYNNIKDIVDDIKNNPAIPSELIQDKVNELMSLIPSSYKGKTKKDAIDDSIPVKQNELSSDAYHILTQIKQIIKDNKGNAKKEKYITFNFYKHVIENKKHTLQKMQSHFHEVLPLAVVEWNYHYWLICYIELTKKLGHFRIDLMCDLQTLEKAKTRNATKKRLIDKVSTSDNIKKYMSEHIYFGNINGDAYIEDEKVISCILKIRNNSQFGITYFYDIFNDYFKVIEEKDAYYIVKVRCTEKSIINIVLSYPNLIELLEPEDVQVSIAMELEKLTKEVLINTNQALANPKAFLYQERMPKKVKDDEKWFYIDATFDHSNDKLHVCKNFFNYLLVNGFKEMALKPRASGEVNRYYVTNQYNSYQEIAQLIKEYANINKRLFYQFIKTYSIYEYKKGFEDKHKEFYRVYYYKGLNADIRPKIGLSDYLKNKDKYE